MLSAFPLTVMLLGTLLVIFALIMTLSADANGAVRSGTSISPAEPSPATSLVTMRVH
jgi:hypothetical protein